MITIVAIAPIMMLYPLHDTWLKSSDLSVLTEDVSQFTAFDLNAPKKRMNGKETVVIITRLAIK